MIDQMVTVILICCPHGAFLGDMMDDPTLSQLPSVARNVVGGMFLLSTSQVCKVSMKESLLSTRS
jgi:hypothetical protein